MSIDRVKLTHKQRRALMKQSSCVWLNLNRRALVKRARRELDEKATAEARGLDVPTLSRRVQWLLYDFYSPLQEHLILGEDNAFKKALNRYEKLLDAVGHGHCDLVGELTGTGFFDFNDFLEAAGTTVNRMRLYERKEERLAQTHYARRTVAQHVMKTINEEVTHGTDH